MCLWRRCHCWLEKTAYSRWLEIRLSSDPQSTTTSVKYDLTTRSLTTITTFTLLETRLYFCAKDTVLNLHSTSFPSSDRLLAVLQQCKTIVWFIGWFFCIFAKPEQGTPHAGMYFMTCLRDCSSSSSRGLYKHCLKVIKNSNRWWLTHIVRQTIHNFTKAYCQNEATCGIFLYIWFIVLTQNYFVIKYTGDESVDWENLSWEHTGSKQVATALTDFITRKASNKSLGLIRWTCFLKLKINNVKDFKRHFSHSSAMATQT